MSVVVYCNSGEVHIRVCTLNPLSPRSDQHQISPCNINALENRVVMSITNMSTHDEFA